MMMVEIAGTVMHLKMRSMLLAIMLAATALAAAANAESRDQDEVRRAVERGEIRALSDILAMVRGKLPGEIAGVEIEHEDGRWVYEFRVIDGKGRLFEVYVNARSGAIERVKEK